MVMRGLSCALLLLAGCSGDNKSIEPTDTGTSGGPPTAQITAPIEGENIRDGALFVARGIASDPDQDPHTLIAHWFIGDEGEPRPCPQGNLPDVEGLTQCDVSFSFDKPSIRLVVTDTDGNTSSDTVSINLVAAEAPEVSITAPDGSVDFRTTDLIAFSGVVSDNEDNPEGIAVWWNSDVQGLLDLSHTVDGDGTVAGSGYLDIGQHTVRLWAEDTSGRQGSASVVLSIFPPAAPPIISIVTPDDGTTAATGEMVLFQANVTDELDSPEVIGIAWDSSLVLDGLLGTDPATSDGTAQLATSTLSEGSHAIRVVATDTDGMTASDTIIVHVGETGDTGGSE
jgi:hypothetical protein